MAASVGRLTGTDHEHVLVERARRGDASAFDDLYERFYGRVFTIVLGVVGDREEANDLTQEVFSLAYRNLHRFDFRSKFSTWLFRIAINHGIQGARKLARRPKIVPLDEAIQTHQREEDNNDAAVYETMARMSPTDRAILVLFYWEQLSLTEIAAALNCTDNAAKTRVYRARERFRALFTSEA